MHILSQTRWETWKLIQRTYIWVVQKKMKLGKSIVRTNIYPRTKKLGCKLTFEKKT